MSKRIRFYLFSCLVLALVLLSASAWQFWQRHQAAPHLFAGPPRADRLGENSFLHILTNPGFAVGYNEFRANPGWVAYRLEQVARKRGGNRPDRFTEDERTLRRIGHDAYTRTGYDRGHLAPNYAMASLYGREAQLASFRMSNIVPQRSRLNRKLWQRLEEVIIDHFAPRFGQLWVITGPIYDADRQRTKAGVDIPDAFFKVLAAHDSIGRPILLAFVMPQRVKGNEPLGEFVVSVDEVERLTGLDLFDALENDLEASLEAVAKPGAWGLDEVGRLPARY